MKSELPKPLHQARGRALVTWVLHALDLLELQGTVIVVGHGGDQVVDELRKDFERGFLFAEQLAQRGTGDAAAVGLSELDLHDNSFSEHDHVLVLPGDTPLLTAQSVQQLVTEHLASGAAATIMTTEPADPTGYGRILRADNGNVTAIVEHRDATPEQRSVREINAGIYCFRRSMLAPALRMISSDNAQGELYLTDVVGVLVEAGHSVRGHVVDPIEVSGVNDRRQLSDVCDVLGRRIAEQHLVNGVTIEQPSSTVIDANVTIEPDVTIRAGTVLEGRTSIDAAAVVGPHAHLKNAQVGAGAVVSYSIVDGQSVAPGATVGPFERLA